MLSEFTEAAHKAGLPAGMAKSVMDFWMGKVAAANEAQQQAQAARVEGGKATLQKEFGQAYDARMAEIQRTIAANAPAELTEALKGDGLLAYPNVAVLIGKLLDKMAEPEGAGGRSGDAAGGERALTPSQAKAAITTLEGDPVKGKALRDRDHPQHKAVLEERNRLLARAG